MSGKHIGTCGHEIDREWLDDPRCNVIRPVQSRDGSPALSYRTECRERAVKGEQFQSPKAADRWLVLQRPKSARRP